MYTFKIECCVACREACSSVFVLFQKKWPAYFSLENFSGQWYSSWENSISIWRVKFVTIYIGRHWTTSHDSRIRRMIFDSRWLVNLVLRKQLAVGGPYHEEASIRCLGNVLTWRILRWCPYHPRKSEKRATCNERCKKEHIWLLRWGGFHDFRKCWALDRKPILIDQIQVYLWSLD